MEESAPGALVASTTWPDLAVTPLAETVQPAPSFKQAVVSTMRQTEDATGAPAVGMAPLGAATKSQAEATWPELSFTQAVTSPAGWTKKDASEASLADTVARVASTSTSPVPSTAGEGTAGEALL